MTRFIIIWLLCTWGQVGHLAVHSSCSIGRASLRGREPGTRQAELLRDVVLCSGWLIIFTKFKNGKMLSPHPKCGMMKKENSRRNATPLRVLVAISSYSLHMCRDYTSDTFQGSGRTTRKEANKRCRPK